MILKVCVRRNWYFDHRVIGDVFLSFNVCDCWYFLRQLIRLHLWGYLIIHKLASQG